VGLIARELDRAYLKPPSGTAAIPRTTRPLAVLIVTYKSHELLEKCLAKVTEHLPELPVYVYENSGDDYPGREEVAARHPHVHWLLGPVNLGFAAAFNALVEHTPPETDLLLLNPDARLLGPLTATRHLLRQPHVAAVVDAEFVGQQDAPSGRAGAGLPVGFLAVEEELFVESADRVPRVAVDRQARAAEVALDVVVFGGLPGVQV
jgi:hypothetical protein